MRDPELETVGATTLMSDIVSGLGRLIRGELMLAKAEATEGLKTAAGGLVKIAVAAVLALVGLNVLAGAAVAGLAATGLGPAWASLIVGVALVVLAVILALAGRAALRLRGMMPDRALRGLRRDVEAVRAGLNRGDTSHV
jgi:hypothetical protein